MNIEFNWDSLWVYINPAPILKIGVNCKFGESRYVKNILIGVNLEDKFVQIEKLSFFTVKLEIFRNQFFLVNYTPLF